MRKRSSIERTFPYSKNAQEYINTKPWDLIFTISYAAHKALNAQEEEENKSETTKSKRLWQLQEQ